MIRRIRRFLPWLGAVAALLLLPLHVQADDIEPEPYVEEEPEPKAEPEEQVTTKTPTAATSAGPGVDSIIFDCIILRPLGFAHTLLGLGFFVPAAVLASPSGGEAIQVAWEHFVQIPAENTFTRPIGDF